MSAQKSLGLVLSIGLLAAMTGLAFGAWLEQGPGMLMALVESGLAWCF